MHLGILTGGGDVPGLNSVIYSIVRRAQARGWKTTGIRRGWRGLVELEPASPHSVLQHTQPLLAHELRAVSQRGGTLLHSSRTNPQRMPSAAVGGAPIDKTPQVQAAIAALGLDAIVAIGGDDTLGYANHLHQHGVPVVGIPKTMDNDVGGTELCVGFATCVARTVHYLHQLRTCTASHERLLVVEVMGRNSGASCLVPAWLADVDRAVIAEVPFEADVLAELLAGDRGQNPEGYAVVVVSEGARPNAGAMFETGPQDGYGHRKLGGVGAALAKDLKARTGIDVVEQKLGYLVRSGAPDAQDVALAYAFSAMAEQCLAGKHYGRMMAMQQGRIAHVPLDCVATPHAIDVERFYDAAAYRPRVDAIGGAGLFLA